jgi:hypothetical protein
MTCFKNVNTLKSLLFVLVLFTVGGILITVTEENLDDLFEQPKIILQSSLEAGKLNLEKISFFGNKEENCELLLVFLVEGQVHLVEPDVVAYGGCPDSAHVAVDLDLPDLLILAF